jgi:hypothetical protein
MIWLGVVALGLVTFGYLKVRRSRKESTAN